MSTICLFNKTRRLLHFNLEHRYFVDQEGQNGVGKPEVLTILSREVVEVDEAALACAEVVNALETKALQVVVRAED